MISLQNTQYLYSNIVQSQMIFRKMKLLLLGVTLAVLFFLFLITFPVFGEVARHFCDISDTTMIGDAQLSGYNEWTEVINC